MLILGPSTRNWSPPREPNSRVRDAINGSHFFSHRRNCALHFGSRCGGPRRVEGQCRPDASGRTPRIYVPETPALHRFDPSTGSGRRAYRLALEFRRHVVAWPPLKRAELSDQLDRASISIALNIAEGAGRTSPRERARHYAIARGSAVERLACLDLLDIEAMGPSTVAPRITLARLTMISANKSPTARPATLV